MAANWSKRIPSVRSLSALALALLSVLPVLVVSLSILAWYIKPMPGEVFLGFSQFEQPVYLALSKKVAEEGRFIFYSSPYAIEEDFPKIYTHLLPILLGYTWKLTGIPLTTLWWMTMMVFGPIMFFLAYQILRIYVAEEKYLMTGAFIIGFGGGLAFLHAFIGSLLSGDDFMTGWMLLESPYDWWFTNLFRVVYYPLEIFAHVLFFSSVYLFLKKKYTYSAIAFSLTWWAHPFTGVLLTAIYSAFFAAEIFLYKRDFVKTALPFLGIALIFISYYLVWIPSFPQAKELLTSFRLSYAARHISPLLYPSAWGVFLFLPLLYGRNVFKEDKTRFLLYWIFVDVILINHDLLIQPGFQPMHFTRGYLFFPLSILSMLGLRTRIRNNAWLILAILIIFSLPDNVLFVYKFIKLGGDDAELEIISGVNIEKLSTYHVNPLRIKETQWDVIRELRNSKEKEVVLANSNIINFLIPVYTDHKTLLGHPEYVPYFNVKLNAAKAYFKTLDNSILKGYGVTMVVYSKRLGKKIDVNKIIYENSDYVLYKVE